MSNYVWISPSKGLELRLEERHKVYCVSRSYSQGKIQKGMIYIQIQQGNCYKLLP
jgi:hypothetical protein